VTGVHFADPLLLGLLVPVAAVVAWRARHRPPAVRFAPAALLGPGDLPAPQAGAEAPVLPVPRVPRTWRGRLGGLPLALEALGLVAAVLAIARPAVSAPLPLVREGVDVLLCVDVSSSMTATDLEAAAASGEGTRPRSRLDVAKEAAVEFVRGRPDDRIGLLTFARFPDLACPPTLDHRALATLVARVEPVGGDDPEDATGVGAAVARAAEVLARGGASARVAIVLTDGEENVARPDAPGEIAPAHAGQLAAALGVRVHAIAAGARGAGPGGRPPPDTRALERLATRTGGAFHEARDAGAVAEVYARIDALERTRFEEERFALEDRHLPLVLAALLLLALGRLLARSPRGVLP
jgi:Ca-activated chloride channel family protein